MSGPGRDQCTPNGLRGTYLLSVEPLLLLAPGLGLDRKSRRRSRQQPCDADRLAGLLAVAVAAFFDAPQSLVDLLEKLALAIPCPKLERVLLFDRRLVGRVGLKLVLAQVLGGKVRLLEQLPLRGEQLVAEERELLRAHVLGSRRAQQFRLGESAVFPGRRSFLRQRRLGCLDFRRLCRGLRRRFLYCFSTKHCSSPLMNRSCGRFLPMKTIVLDRFSPLPHGRPTSPPMSMCTPWNTTRWVLPFMYSTPL